MFQPDTSPEVQQIYNQMLRRLSESERFVRGLSLTHFVREICMAGIRARHPAISTQDLRLELFERIYGESFLPPEKEKIREGIRAAR